MTSASDAGMQQWQQQRAARLAALPWLQTQRSDGRTVRFAKDEILVLADHEQTARDVAAAQGIAADQISVTPATFGYIRVAAPGLVIVDAIQALRTQHGPTAAGANHVFVSTAKDIDGFEMGGPYGPPVGIDAYTLPSGPSAGASVRVTVMDTGVWRNSPLPPAWYEASPADMAHSQADDLDTGHANFITGVIMSHTDNARVRIIKVLDPNGVCSEQDLADALGALDDVDVINLSLGGFSTDDQPPVLLQAALLALLAGRDRVVVAAAGNEGVAGRPYWPAGFSGTADTFSAQVIAVAAHDGTAVCTWSNTGPWVDMSAPGSAIASTFVEHADFPTGFASWSGTSFAAPFVVAVIAAGHARAGTIAGSVDAVKKQAATHLIDGTPGLV
jgi:thermitase